LKSIFLVFTLCTLEVRYEHFAGLWRLHLQAEMIGAKKKGIDIGMECKRGQSTAANKEREGALFQPVGSGKL